VLHVSSSSVISTILRHDVKITSYKIALLRAINDVVLAFPDVGKSNHPVAVPIRILAEFWVAYYWPFVRVNRPIWQGRRAVRLQGRANDMAFRAHLTNLRRIWESLWQVSSRSSDGFIVVNEMRVPRKRAQHPVHAQTAYDGAIAAIARTIEQMPIRHAGPGEWTVFDKPVPYRSLSVPATPVPGTSAKDKCLLVSAEIWLLFRRLSLWIEALCIHEWCLFGERVDQTDTKAVDRGDIYRLMTDRPGNRRPLTWERNQFDILMMEGQQFICPWTQRHISYGTAYDIDYLVPVSVYPMNELWNLVPTDRDFNQHKKRDRLSGPERLAKAEPILAHTYDVYVTTQVLAQALFDDVALRFTTVDPLSDRFTREVASAAAMFIRRVAESRNLARF